MTNEGQARHIAKAAKQAADVTAAKVVDAITNQDMNVTAALDEVVQELNEVVGELRTLNATLERIEFAMI